MRDEFKNIPLRKNEDKKCFEIEIDGSFAFIRYKEMADQIALIHTEVHSALNGKGAAGAVVEKTLNYIENQGKKLLPFCPYVFAYLKKHPEYKSLVDPSFNGYDKL
ncbi:GNAT family N-acetyltransferase [Winogradskyella thalassocola]|uniref:N-acetyltransferase domain-containing protein n=1 Tax=Winogradskyella thalassocola TaxID=262004 RepID=A0A1G8IBW2_9FLAO|nr:GNAT family N-acetyltransferase [Winogradskyella thalassocola]SDI16050.1 hypothetical protein SAMN04489796_107192 [Winogradskyella thalassocola]